MTAKLLQNAWQVSTLLIVMVMVLKIAILVLQALTALEMTPKLCALQAQLLTQVPSVLMTVKS